MNKQMVSRRAFLQRSAAVGIGATLAACGAPAASTPEGSTPADVSTVAVGAATADERAAYTLRTVDPGTATSLTIMMWENGFNPVEDEAVRTFLAKYYPNMTLTMQPGGDWDTYWQKLPVIMAAGDQPDLAGMHFTRTADFAAKGWMLPIDDMLKSLPPEQWPEGYFTASVDNMAFDGKQYGLPMDWAPRLLLINRTLVEPVLGSWPPPDGWTWDQILDTAKQVTKETDQGKIFGLGIGSEDIQVWNFVKEFGGDFFNAEVTESRFNDPKTVAAFQWLWDAQWKHKVVPTSADEGSLGGSDGGFEAGRIGILSVLSDGARHFVDATKGKFDLGVAPEPLGPGGRFGFEGNVGLIIPTKAKNPQVAYELMRYLLTDDAVTKQRAATSFFPGRKSGAETHIQQLEGSLPGFGRAAFEIGSQNEAHFPLFPGYLEWQNIWNKWTQPVFIEGQPDIPGAMEGMHRETNEFFAKQRGG